MPLRTLLAISAILCCNTAVAGLKEGYEALSRQDYATAIKEYRPLAERGNAEAQ
jgi:TPR repeat protein